MKFKIDENLPNELAADLVALGHDAETVPGEGLTGASDPALLAEVQAEQRALLTMDKGIADVRVYPPQNYGGLVLFRPSSSGRNAVLNFVRRQLPAVLAMDLVGHLIVVSASNIRIR